MEPELVVEVGIDVARDASGRCRAPRPLASTSHGTPPAGAGHPARWHRPRPDLTPTDVPRLSAPPH
ncbi:ATP-dependent DNA ligase [Streptomyces griseosporeus]|uniref:ATP-dependent DNA ligase n=1 Tax=Streptomyces griseosporeus TaxID=1910 RepID=UPI0036811660